MKKNVGGRDAVHEGMPDAVIDFMNESHAGINTWIKAGGLKKRAKVIKLCTNEEHHFVRAFAAKPDNSTSMAVSADEKADLLRTVTGNWDFGVYASKTISVKSAQ